jgi:predicted PurR-regulated permease PerM
MPTWLKYTLALFGGLLIAGPIGAVVAVVVLALLLNKSITVTTNKK